MVDLLVLVVWGIGLLGGLGLERAGAQEEPVEDAGPAPSELEKSVAEYVGALEGAASMESSQARLGLRLTLYPNAWERHALERLRLGWSQKRSTDDLVEELKSDRKTQRLLDDKALFRVDLVHTGIVEADPEAVQPVHLMLADLPEALRLRAGDSVVAWKTLREPTNLELARVRIGKQHTVKNGQLVPFVSPMKPDRSRAVFRGARASFEGVLPSNAFDKKHRRLAATLAFDEFSGRYDGDHLINLNEVENTLERDQTLEAEIKLPLFFPAMPATVRELLDRCKAE